MRKLKVLLKRKDKELSNKVGMILKKKNIDVYRISKFGVYFKINEDDLHKHFKCELHEDDDCIIHIEIPPELEDSIVAIYEPGKPHYHK